MVQSLLVALVLLCFCSYSNAQVSTNPTQTTPDLLDPSAQNWSGTYGTGYWGQSQGGPNPNRIPNNSGFIWSGGNNIISTTIAINTALSQAGIQVDGFNYKWRVKNGNANWFAGQPGVDDFEITVEILDSNGNVFQTYTYDYGHSHNWTNHTGQELFGTNFLPPSYFSDINISAQGSDSSNWPGWYGPEFNVRDSEFNLIFSANPCHNNALYDPQCPGYANALFQQQCTANPLFDSSCPGYAAAFFIQQCTANPLHDPSCTGYAQAYYNQQCSLNPLYDSGCTGYAQAYYNQQCSLNPLYDTGCTGYKVAYHNQQCSLNPLYDTTCAGYAQAYLNQQCSLDPLYDASCTGHLTAQCNIDPLYDPTCTGYADAYLAQQCDYDPLYDVQCIGYQQAYFDYQCEMDSQYDSSCPNFVAALEDILDDGTTIDPIADALATPEVDLDIAIPEVPVVVVTEIPTVEEPVSAEYKQTQGDMMKMEDDIEKEIAELERESEENNQEEEEVNNPFEKSREESDIGEIAESVETTDGESGDGKTIQEDDIEKELAQLKADAKTEKKVVKTEPLTKNDKIRMLLAKKANELTKEMENLATLEQQMLVQRQLLALISFVPGFDYNDKDVIDLANFYPDKPTVDHEFSRWFLNDPNFGAMEDLQYPNGFN